MAADASQRKALRYQQTLVGLYQIFLYLPACLLSCLSLKMSLLSPLLMSLHLLLHLPTCHFLTVPYCSLFTFSNSFTPAFHYFIPHNYLLVVCFHLSHLFSSTSRALYLSWFSTTSHKVLLMAFCWINTLHLNYLPPLPPPPPPLFSSWTGFLQLYVKFICKALKHINSLSRFHTAHVMKRWVRAINGKSSLQ